MADIRRRFGLHSEHGTLLRDDEGLLHVGLPRQAAEALVELKRKHKVGLEYDHGYEVRIVTGVYPLRIRTGTPLPPRPGQRGEPPEEALSEDEWAQDDGAEPAAAPQGDGLTEGRRGRRRARARGEGR
jgi:hypothetical protein